jgi:hypothetical protein
MCLKFVADFETTTSEDDCRVWAVAWVNLESVYLPNYGNTLHIENNITSFIDYFKTLKGEHECYFHNLKFDGSFIIDYLLRIGFVNDDTLSEENTFSTLITDAKIFYQIKVRFADIPEINKNGKPKMRKGQPVFNKCIINFKDSLKKIPLRVSDISKAYGVEELKTSIDYEAYRPVGYELTPEEKEYVANDVIIVAKALYQMIVEQGQTSLTISGDALSEFKHRFANVPRGSAKAKKQAEDYFRQFFPLLSKEADDFIRLAYKGGYTYTNPKYQGQLINEGLVYDVNSLYPSQMYQQLLPYGVPVYCKGEIHPTDEYPLFIQHLKCTFTLKEGYLPIIQLKNNPRFHETEYLTHSDSVEELYLTSVDLMMFLEHYEVYDLEFIDGFKFKGRHGVFTKYIDYWMEIKKKEKGGKRQLAKLMLNCLYGKFATAMKALMKEPYLDESEDVKYRTVEKEEREPVYTAMACFITAYARLLMISTAQKCYDRFLYCDTDSLHVVGLDIPPIDIHPKDLGKWKCEGVFCRAKYLRAKTYLESFCCDESGNPIDNPDHLDKWHHTHTEVKCAGMPENVKHEVNYGFFYVGKEFDGKKMPKTVKGGVVLVERTFKIKEH